MKIKHWQGYGCVNAQKISKKIKNNICTLHIRVKGNHECGIHRDDRYDIANWLIKRFDRSFTDYRRIIDMKLQDGYENGVETCDYIINYET